MQNEMTLNFLCQSIFNQTISSWEYFSGPFQYDATPLGYLGMIIVIHKKASRCHSWDLRETGRMECGSGNASLPLPKSGVQRY